LLVLLTVLCKVETKQKPLHQQYLNIVKKLFEEADVEDLSIKGIKELIKTIIPQEMLEDLKDIIKEVNPNQTP